MAQKGCTGDVIVAHFNRVEYTSRGTTYRAPTKLCTNSEKRYIQQRDTREPTLLTSVLNEFDRLCAAHSAIVPVHEPEFITLTSFTVAGERPIAFNQR
jgi:hypothetical protein